MKMQNMSVGVALALAGYTAAASAAEPSATLRHMQGSVFVTQATAMGPARDGMPLYAGDRVVAVAGGAAQLVYANGCTVDMPQNSMLAMGGADQCSSGKALVRTTEGFQDKAIGQTVPTSLQPAAANFVNNFGVYTSSVDMANAWGSLSASAQTQVLAPGVLTQDQLAGLYAAVGSQGGPAAAQGFYNALAAAQGSSAANAVAGAATSGLTGAGGTATAGALGGVSFGALEAGLAIAAIAAVVVGASSGNGGGGGNVSLPIQSPTTNPPAS